MLSVEQIHAVWLKDELSQFMSVRDVTTFARAIEQAAIAECVRWLHEQAKYHDYGAHIANVADRLEAEMKK